MINWPRKSWLVPGAPNIRSVRDLRLFNKMQYLQATYLREYGRLWTIKESIHAFGVLLDSLPCHWLELDKPERSSIDKLQHGSKQPRDLPVLRTGCHNLKRTPFLVCHLHQVGCSSIGCFKARHSRLCTP